MTQAARRERPSTQVLVAGYQRLDFFELRERARASHPMHTLEAAQVFVDRALDMEAETRLGHDHGNPGFQPFSPTATLGEQPGGGAAAAEPLAIMYERYRELSPKHRAARAFIQGARLHPRQLLAVLVREAKGHPSRTGDLRRSYDDIARDPAAVAQMLGFGPVAVMGDVRRGAGNRPLFKNGMAIKNAARDARAQLVMLAQV